MAKNNTFNTSPLALGKKQKNSAAKKKADQERSASSNGQRNNGGSRTQSTAPIAHRSEQATQRAGRNQERFANQRRVQSGGTAQQMREQKTNLGQTPKQMSFTEKQEQAQKKVADRKEGKKETGNRYLANEKQIGVNKESRFGDITAGTVKQIGGGHLTSLGHDSNDYNEFKKNLEQQVLDGKISESTMNKNLEAYKRSNTKANRDQDWQDSKLHEKFQKIEQKGQELNAKGDAQVEKAKEGLGTGGKLLADAYSSTLGMASDMMLGPAWAASMMSRSYGNTLNQTRELVDKGIITEKEAENNAGLQAAKEAATEYMFAGAGLAKGLKGVGKATEAFEGQLAKGIDKLAARIPEGVLRNAGYSTLKSLGGIAEESTEELAGGILDPMITNLAYANKAYERTEGAQIRNNLQMNSTSLQDQLNALVAQGYNREEMLNMYASEIGSDEYKAETIADLMNSGYSEKEAKKLAAQMQNYMLASLSGDEKALKKAEDSVVKEFGKYSDIRSSFSWSETGEAMASAAIMVAATGAPGMVTKNQQGAAIKKAYEDVQGGRNAASNISWSALTLDDEKMASRAQAMYEQAQKGEDLANEQYAELHQALMKQREINVKNAESSYETARKMADKDRLFARGGTNGVDENNNVIYTGAVTQRAATTLRGEINVQLAQAEEAFGQMDDAEKHDTIEGITSVLLGQATPDTVESLTTNHPIARSIYESITGEKLPASNEATRNALFEASANNYVEMARAETVEAVDVGKGGIDENYMNQFGSAGQGVYKKLSDGKSVEDTTAYVDYVSTISKVYDAGAKGLSEKTAIELAATQGISEADAKELYAAGKNDAATSAGGRVTTSFKNGGNLRSSAREVYMAIAKMFNVNIELTDDISVEIEVDAKKSKDKTDESEEAENKQEKEKVIRQANGQYDAKTNTLTLNLNEDITKNVGYTVMHELTHKIKTNNLAGYKAFAKMFEERWIEKNGKASLEAAINERIERYKGADELSRDDAIEEIIADQMGELLHDRAFISRFAAEETDGAVSVLSAIRDIIRKITQLFAVHGGFRSDYNEALLSELGLLREAEMFFANSIQEARSQQTQEMLEKQSGKSKFDISPTLRNELNAVLAGTMSAKNNEVYIGNTSDFLQNEIGITPYDVTMPIKKAYAAMVDESTAKAANRYDDKLNYHNLGADGLIDALESAETPVLAIVSEPDPVTNEDRSDTIALVTDVTDENGKVVVVYETVDTTGFVNKRLAKVNKVLTSFGRGDIDNYINRAIREGRVLYIDKKRSHVIGGTWEQSPSVRNIDFKKNIQNFISNVNYKRGKTSLPHETYSSTALADAFKRAKPLKAPMKYSLDSEGRELAPGQQEFFKASQARDEDGNLQVVYHTTNYGGFTVFDPKYSDDRRSLFFASDFDVSQTYGKYADEPIDLNSGERQKGYYAAYLNLVNPLIIDANGSNFSSISMKKEMSKKEEKAFAESIKKKVKEYAKEWELEEEEIPSVYFVSASSRDDFTPATDESAAKLTRTVEILSYEQDGDEWKPANYKYETSLDLERGEDEIEEAIDVLITNSIDEIYAKYPYADALMEMAEIFVDNDGNFEWSNKFATDREYVDGIKLDDKDADKYTPYRKNNTRGWAAYAERNGYDGVIFRNLIDQAGPIQNVGYKPTDIYVAFDSNQVKSIDNENPTEDPDIRYSIDAAEVESELYKPADEDATSAPMVKFSFGERGTWLGGQVHSNSGSNPTGNAQINKKTREALLKSGKERLTEVMGSNIRARLKKEGIKGKEAKAIVNEEVKRVTDFLDYMNDMFVEMATGDIYTFVGLDQVMNAQINARRGEDGSILSVSMSAMIKNGEYPVNFDFTTICKKRQAFNAIIEKLSKESGKDVAMSLTPGQLMDINQALRKEGVETACLGCFVEARRYHMKNYTTKVVELWNGLVDEEAARQGIPLDSIEDFGFSDETELTEKEYQAAADTFLDYENTKVDKKSPESRFRQIIKSSNGKYLKHITAADLVTAQGIEKIKGMSTAKFDLLGMFKSAYGVSAPKETIAFAPYNSEIDNLPKTKDKKPYVEYLKKIGGVRMQSFSDFLIANTFDYMQMVADMAARGFPAHAYTKEIAFAKIFGQTGIKINMSIMFDVENAKTWGEAFGIEDAEEQMRIAKKYAGLQFFKSKEDAPDYLREHCREVTENGVTGYVTFLVSDKRRSDEHWQKTFEQEFARNGGDEVAARQFANERRKWTQSIDFKDAKELQKQDGYSKNVGIIGVGLSDQNILMMLEDEAFPYIIPYHASGLPEVIKVLTNLNYATNYEDTQNTRIFVGITDAEGKTYTQEELAKRKEELGSWSAVYKELNVEGTVYEGRTEDKENGEKNKDGDKYNLAGTGGFDFYKQLEKGKKPQEISEMYLEYCAEYGLLPVFPQFAGHENYYKLLIDYNVTDIANNNAPSPQVAVTNNYPGVDVDAGESDYSKVESLIKEEAAIINEQNRKRDEVVENYVKNAKLSLDKAEPAEETEERVELTPVVAEDAVIKYSVSKSSDSTSFIEDCLEGDTSDEAQARRQKSRDEIEATLAHIVRKDTQLTYGKTLNRKSVKKPIKELVFGLMESSENTYSDKVDAYNYAMDMADAIWHKFYNKEADLSDLLLITSRELVEDIKFVDDDMYKAYNDLRRYMRDHRISVPEFVKEDISWADYRKKNFGRMLLTTESGFELDKMWHEISPMLVPFVDATEYTADGSDNLRNVKDMSSMFLAISDALDNTKAYRDAYADAFAQDIELQFAKDLAAITINQGEAWESFADKKKEYYETRAKEMQARHKVAMRELREQRDRKLDELRKEKTASKEKLRAQKNKKIDKLEQKRRDDLDKQKQKYEQREEKRKAEEREKKEKQKAKKQDHRARMKAFGHIEKNYNWLTKRLLDPKKEDGQHIPEGFINSLASVLSAFDLQTERSKSLEERTGKVSKPTEALRKMREELQELSKEDESGIFVYNGALFSIMDNLIKSLNGHPLRDLNTEDLTNIDDMLASIKHMIQNENTLFADAKKQAASSAGDAVIWESKEKITRYGRRYDRKGPFGTLNHLLNEDMMTPMNFFKSLGTQMRSLYKHLRYGQDDYIRKIDELRHIFDDMFKPYRKKGFLGHARSGSVIEEWQNDKSAQTFKAASGEEVTMSVAQMMSLYCLSKREQAMRHILGNGVVLSDVKMTKLMDKVTGKVERTASSVRLTYDDVIKITDSLTQEQKELAQKMQELMNGKLQEWGNETSMQLYGIRLFKEKNYFPIESSNSYLPGEIGKASGIKGNKITSFGFTKPLTEGANNPIVIGDIFDIVTDHANKMALYSAYAAPLTDFNRVMNYVKRDEDTGLIEGSVKQVLQDAYGPRAIKFIDNLLDDINGQANTRMDGMQEIINKSLGNYKSAAIGFNLRVLVQQPTAILRATYYINPKYFINPSEANLKKNVQEMHEHCPIAAWKAWGNYQNDFSRGLQDIITNNSNSMWETMTMGVYGLADDMTWGMIWGAVKNEIKDTYPSVKYGSEEFWTLCNERASLVFDETQVVDSVFHRSDAMRSKDTATKLVTSFMAEPTRTYNMIRSSIVMSYRYVKGGDKISAINEMSKAITVFVANAAAVSAAAAVVDALRGKGGDDDDDWYELWMANFLDNFKDNGNLLNNIVWVKDISGMIVNAMSGEYLFGTSNMALEGWYKFAKGLSGIKDVLSGEMSIFEFITGDFGAGLGYITGVPTFNMVREVKTLWTKLGLPVFAGDGTEESDSDSGSSESVLTKGIFSKLGIGPNEAERYAKYTDKLAKKYSGKSDENMLEMATDGYRKLVDSGDFFELSARREAIRRAGGDVDAFDEKIHSYVGTSYKKTIGDSSSQEDFNKQQAMKDWMLSNGWTEQQISDVVYRSDTARDFKAACRMLDHDAAVEALVPLLEAGLTEQDIYKLWNNRNRGNYDTSSTGTYVWGTDGTITSGFGNRGYVTAGASSYHQGIDIGAEMGTNVVAADGGVVTFAGNDGSGYGNYIIVTHDNGTQTYYGHLSGIGVKKGQRVSQSQPIGNVGSTGVSTGPHLHFAMKINGSFVDPSKYIKQ